MKSSSAMLTASVLNTLAAVTVNANTPGETDDRDNFMLYVAAVDDLPHNARSLWLRLEKFLVAAKERGERHGSSNCGAVGFKYPYKKRDCQG